MAVFNVPNYLEKDGFGMTLNIRRGNPNPLDNSSVWASFAEAKNYAETDVTAYVGQIITVVENGAATAYVIDNEAGSLKEVGSAPLGDGKSIKVDEESGEISIYGFDGAEEGYIPRVKKVAAAEGVEEHYEIEWVLLNDVVQDTNTVTTIEAVDKSLSIEDSSAEEDKKTYAAKVNISAKENNRLSLEDDGLYVEKPAEVPVPEYAIKVVDSDTSTKYYLTKDGVEVETAIEVPDFDPSVLDDYYTKEQTNEKIAEEIGKQIHISTQVVETVPSAEEAKEGVIYLYADPLAESGTYVEYILVTKEDGSKSVEAIGSTQTDLTDYITTEELENYITNTTIKHTDETDEVEAFTFENGVLKVVVDAYKKGEVYTKTETETKISDMIRDINGGESAGEVLAALNTYKQTVVDPEIWGDTSAWWTEEDVIGEDGQPTGEKKQVYSPNYSAASRIDKLEQDLLTEEQVQELLNPIIGEQGDTTWDREEENHPSLWSLVRYVDEKLEENRLLEPTVIGDDVYTSVEVTNDGGINQYQVTLTEDTKASLAKADSATQFIDVEDLPTENIKIGSIYRKPDGHQTGILLWKDLDDDPVVKYSADLYEVDVLPENPAVFRDYQNQTEATIATLYKVEETIQIANKGFDGEIGWSTVDKITSEDEATQTESFFFIEEGSYARLYTNNGVIWQELLTDAHTYVTKEEFDVEAANILAAYAALDERVLAVEQASSGSINVNRLTQTEGEWLILNGGNADLSA